MARLFTSDTHFRHRNVIKYCNRPWDNTAEMDEAIIEQWNSQVGPDDEVYHLGDVGIGKGMALKEDLIKRLNGKKHLVLGNHDAMFNTLHKNPDCVETHAKVANKYLKAGWCSVDIIKYLMLKDGTHVVMTHLPPDNGIDNRYSQYKVKNNPNFNYLHGHLHAHYLKKNNMHDMAFDGNLRLYTEDEVIAIIKDERDFIPSRITEYYNKTEAIMLKPFEEERKKGNIRRQDNFNGDLCLYNYTDQCTFDRAWNDVTRNSRGIVFEVATGKIIALPFPKFFNLGEMPETRLENLPDEEYVVTEKMDGSLGILYYYKDKWRMNTRGSFDSEQAIKGLEIFNKQYDSHFFNQDYTYLVEIIYPENKIVVDYGKEEKLVLLAIVDTNNQKEVVVPDMAWLPEVTAGGMPYRNEYKYTIDEMIELQQTLPKDDEGFVVRFNNGLRVKIKGKEYLRVHKLISHMTPLAFWESMEGGKVKIDYLQELPEEYRKDAEELSEILQVSYRTVEVYALDSVDRVIRQVGFGDINTQEYRKKIGLYLKNNKVPHQGFIFPYLYGKKESCERYIMNQIRPKGNVIDAIR